MSVFLAEDLV